MRKILQSKAGVGLLCVGAVLAVAGNFVSLPARRPVAAAARKLVAAAPAESLTVPAPLRVDQSLRTWRELFPERELTRDPFAIVLAAMAEPSSPAVAPVLKLQAVSIEGDRVLAVVNGRVLAIGESLGDYQLERALPTEVHFKSRWGRLIVPLEPAIRLAKPPSGTSPPADLIAQPIPRSSTGTGR
jgi:hypothetical protein